MIEVLCFTVPFGAAWLFRAWLADRMYWRGVRRGIRAQQRALSGRK